MYMNPLSAISGVAGSVTKGAMDAAGSVTKGAMDAAGSVTKGAMGALEGLKEGMTLSPSILLAPANMAIQKGLTFAEPFLRDMKKKIMEGMKKFTEEQTEKGPYKELEKAVDVGFDFVMDSVKKAKLGSVTVWKPLADTLLKSMLEIPEKKWSRLMEIMNQEFSQVQKGGGMEAQVPILRRIMAKEEKVFHVGDYTPMLPQVLTPLASILGKFYLMPQVQLATRMPGIDTIPKVVLFMLFVQYTEDVGKLEPTDEVSEDNEIKTKITHLLQTFLQMVSTVALQLMQGSFVSTVETMIKKELNHMLFEIQELMEYKNVLDVIEDKRLIKVIEVLDGVDLTGATKREPEVPLWNTYSKKEKKEKESEEKPKEESEEKPKEKEAEETEEKPKEKEATDEKEEPKEKEVTDEKEEKPKEKPKGGKRRTRRRHRRTRRRRTKKYKV